MHFPAEYFEKEVIGGFEVSSLMKRCWAAQMEVMDQVDRICKKLGIKYFLAYGTLLGAVRHKGFIPWDDDIDLWFLREDLDRFLNESIEELSTCGLELVTPFSDSDYHNLCFRVINTRVYRVDKDFLYKYWMFPFMAGVDLIPLDYVPRDKQNQELLRTLYVSANQLACYWNDETLTREERLSVYYQLLEVTGLPRVEEDKIEAQLWQISDRIGAMFGSREADQVASLAFMYKDNGKVFDKEWFNDTVGITFEGLELPAPIKYEKVLKAEFGNDYMTPKRIYETHDYPYYKKWHNRLAEDFKKAGIELPAMWKEL